MLTILKNTHMTTLELYYIDPALGAAWRELFASERNVRIIKGSILNCRTDAIVSPANSFGFMDGGLDYYISERFGWHLQDELQKRIRALPEHELLVGKAMTINTGDPVVRFLISAPTMRVPMSSGISESLTAYLAMKAILICSQQNPEIRSVAVPGLCTGTGNMPYDVCALQMFQAWNEIQNGNVPVFNSFPEAQRHHQYLNRTCTLY